MQRKLPTCFIAALVFIAACKKDQSSKPDSFTNQQAAGMIALTLATNTNGFANIKNDVVLYAKALPGASKGCGVLDSFAVARQQPSTATIDYNYAIGYHYLIGCAATVQDTLNNNITYNGSFDAANLSVINSGTLNSALISLSDKATNYKLNGVYTSTGSYITNDGTNFSGSYTITVNVKDMLLNKSSRATAGGTASISISGTVKNKNDFSFDGSLTFKNSSTAQLVLDGANYQINLTTGAATPN